MNGRANGIGWALAVAFAWGWAWWHLAREWGASEQYQYGFGVPFLAAFVAWKRWDGPLAPAPRGRGSVGVLIIAWLVLGLGELLRWHDPLWRLTGGLLTLGATLFTAVWFYRAGGVALLRREVFPLAFAWVAVPWPVPVETAVTQGLLRAITTVTIAILNGFGIAAFQRGNVIELASGVVGMDDACSGIRSFQAALMVALFLGEFFRLGVARRITLLFIGVVVSMGANLARVLALAFITHTRGAAGFEQAHDWVGGLTSVLTFGLIFFAALKLEPRMEPPPLARQPSRWAPGMEGGLVCASVVAIPLLAWLWFSQIAIPAADLPQTAQWRLDASRVPPGWRAETTELSPSVREALRYSEGRSLRVQSDAGWSANAIHLVWEPGASIPGMAFYHTPALCMPGIGWLQVGEPVSRWIDVRGERLPCVVYRFRQGDSVQIAVQSFMSGGRADFHLVDAERLGGRGERLSMLWRAPLRQVNEELLVYLPDLGGADLQAKTIGELLDAVLVKAALEPKR